MAFPTTPTTAAGRIAGLNQLNTTATLTGPNLTALTARAAGDIVIAIAGEYQSNAGADAAYTGWAGGGLTWNEIRDSTGTADVRLGVAFARLVTGTETGAITVTRSGTLVGDASMIIMCIPGAHPALAPETTAMAVGTTTAADPASLNPGNWGTNDTLWISVAGNGMTAAGGSWTGIDGAPANYTDLFETNATDTSTIGDFSLGVAFRQLNAASEDSGSFSQDISNARSGALLIAVPPGIFANTVNAWRVRNDDGNETGASWIAAEDTNPASPIDADTNFRIRYRAGDTGGAAGTWTLPQLQRNLNESTWGSVTSSSTVVRASGSTHFSDGAATTGQLTGGSGGSFVAGTMDDVDGQAANISLGALGNSEVEFCVQIRSADVGDADSIEFRVLDNGIAIPVHAGGPTVVVNEIAAFTFSTSSWRLRNDDGSESAASWIAAEDTNATILAGRPFRVRFRGGDTGGVSGTWTTPQLQYNRNSAGWNNVTDSSSIVRSIASSNFADNAATTTQLTGGNGGTFIAGTMDEVNGAVASISLGANGNSEVEFSVEIRTADIADNDIIELRVLNNGSAVTETTGHPSITANIPDDTLAVGITDTMALEKSFPITDTITVGTAIDSMIVEKRFTVTDTLNVGLTDSVSVDTGAGGGAISFIEQQSGWSNGDSASSGQTTASNIVFTLGGSVQVGDVVLLIQADNFYALSNLLSPQGTAVTTWAERTDNGLPVDGGTNDNHARVWIGTVTTAGGTVIARRTQNDDEGYAQIFVFRNAEFDNADATETDTAATSHVAPALTPTSGKTNDYLVSTWGTQGVPTNYTVPGSMTPTTEQDVFGICTYRSAYEQLTTDSNTGTRTATSSGNDQWFAVSVLMKSTGAATPIDINDTLNVSLTDSLTYVVNVAPTDTLNVGITDSMAIEKRIALTDSLNVSLTESVSIEKRVSDTLNVGVTDTILVQNSFALTDTLNVGVTDTISLEKRFTLTDTPTVGVTDTIVIQTQTAQTDTLSTNVTDVMTIEKRFPITDTLSTNVTDSMALTNSLATATDTLSVGITDSISVSSDTISKDVNDSLNVGVTDSMSVAVSISATDNIGISFGTSYNAAVREFDGSDDRIIFDHSAMTGIDGTEKNTLAFIWRADTIHAGALFYLTGATATIYGVNPYSSGFVWYGAGGNAIQGPAYNADEWYLTIFTKDSGTSVVRSHTYNYVTEAWSHVNHNSLGTGSNAPATFFQMGRWAANPEYLDGWLAAAAIWVDTMPWDVDADGDAAIEAAGLESNLQSWIDNNPTNLWVLNQASTSNPVLDMVGDADQTSIDGTTVDTSNLPTNFSYGSDETIEIDISLSRTDDISVGITDSIALEKRIALTDSLNVGITDNLSFGFTPISVNDTLNVGVTDVMSVQVQISITDTLNTNVTDVMSLNKTIPLSDSLNTNVTDSIALEKRLGLTDTLNVGVIDSLTYIVQLSRSDTLDVGITDSIALEKRIALTDSLNVSLVEVFNNTRTLTATDTLNVGITDSISVEASGTQDKPVSDSINVGITDSVSVAQQENKIASDSLSVGLTDTLTIAGTLPLTDSIAVAFSEAMLLSVNISRTDTLNVGVTDTISVQRMLAVSDTLSVGLTDSMSLDAGTIPKNVSDSLGIALGSAGHNAAARNFDGALDYIIIDNGSTNFNGSEEGTMAFLWRANTVHAGWLLKSGTPTWSVNPYSDGKLYFATGGVFAEMGTYPTDEWLLTVITKPAENDPTPTQARMHTYNFTTNSWSHANAAATMLGSEQTPPTAYVIGSDTGSQHLDGDIAAVAMWMNNSPWAMNASGDAAIESAGLHTNLQSWIDNDPSVLWILNQSSTATAVTEYFGTGADQTTLSGTSVITTGLPDTFGYGQAETMEIAVSLSRTDTLLVGITDTMQIQGSMSRTDTLSVGLTDSISVGILIPTSDTIAVGLTDDISVEQSTLTEQNLSDNISVGLTELFEIDTSQVKRWDGAVFVGGGQFKRFNGTDFVSGGTMRRYAGNGVWVPPIPGSSLPKNVSDSLGVGIADTIEVDNGESAPMSPPAGTRFSTGEDLGLLVGPSSAPPGSVVVDPDTDDLGQVTLVEDPGTTFYLLEGRHLLGGGSPSEFAQIQPKAGNTYIGAPGAVLDGRNINRYAFTQEAEDVTIRYLEVINFNSPLDEFVVNHNCGTGWTIEYCNIHHNVGAAIGLGTDNVLRHTWLHHNSQYGFSIFKNPVNSGADAAVENILVEFNEVHDNGDPRDEFNPDGTFTYFGRNGGCKFWDTRHVELLSNWIHSSYLTGLWADTNDSDFLLEGNLIEDNWGEGFFYEISYNFKIIRNTFRRNAIKKGLSFNYRTDGFPVSAIYISESGSEPAIGGLYSTSSEITDNNFINNWGDITLWENADRFCNSPANTSGKIWKPLGGGASLAICNNPDSRTITVTLTNGSPSFTVTSGTLAFTDEGQFVNGTGITVGTKIREPLNSNNFAGGYVDATHGILDQNATASGSITMTIEAGSIDGEPAYTECRWHTQNVDIHDNVFHHNAGDILGPNNVLESPVVTGKQAILSQYGTFPTWSPYQGTTIQQAVTHDQNNVWHDNEYEGDYAFLPFDTSNLLTDFADWQDAPYNQDAGSTFSATPPTGGGGGDIYPPDPPTNIVAVAGNTQARVSFDPPDDFGGDFIIGYTVTASPGGATATARTGPITVSGLTNGQAYTFTVKTRTTIDIGVASSASNSVTPSGAASLPADTIPWHPIHVNAHSKTPTSAEVSFLLPSSDGGDTITEYVATSSPGGLTGSASSSPVIVNGLTADTEYTFTVTAENSIGVGPASHPTKPITT